MNVAGTKKWDGTKWVPVNVARDGQRATLNGKPVVRKGDKWVPVRASTRSRNRRSTSRTSTKPTTPKSTKTTPALKDIPASKRPKDMQAGKVYGDAGQPPAPKLPPKPQRAPQRAPQRTPARVPKKEQSSNMDANYRAWAKANPGLAKKVKKGQAGFNSINNNPVSTKTEEEKKKKKQQMMSGTTRQSINQGLA